MFHIIQLRAGFNKWFNLLHGTLDSPRDLVNILRLNNSFKIIFQHFRKVVCTKVSIGSNEKTVPVLTLEF